MKSNLQKFKEFINKGNVVALAIGVIMATEFGKVVNSLVADIIMPPIGKLIGGVDFGNLYIPLSKNIPAGATYVEAQKYGAVIGYGTFITVIITFLVVAYCVFLLSSFANKFSKTPEAPAPEAK
jgi:large conductance mechanosensitive channel